MLKARDLIRKSKNQTSAEKIWSAALYVRLSREDGDKEESDSIGNQKEILYHYVSGEADIRIAGMYVDDGWSGTNFNRPDFQRMYHDIETGLVNCVIVKDLSRFGRNYIDVGNYIEKEFPGNNIRFISVSDGLDSVKNPQTMDNIIVPFKNLINDEYCRDISNKVRSSLNIKRKQGKHIGSFACYGYMKDPEDHNHLIIDPVASDIVRDIYRWYISGMSLISIARNLNSLEVPCPSLYKKMCGLNYKNPNGIIQSKKILWCDSTVRRILTNLMYTGTMVQGTMKVKSYKIQVIQRMAPEDWFIVENTHEPIISKEDFALVQEILSRNKRTSPAQKLIYPMSGYLRCADCGKGMSRKNITHPYADYNYFVCSTYTKKDKTACTRHTIREEVLEKLVLSAIQSQIALAVDMEKTIQMIKDNSRNKNDAERIEMLIHQSEAEKERIENMILDLYPDWKSGSISQKEYIKLKSRFEEELQTVKSKIDDLMKRLDKVQGGQEGENEFIANFIKYQNIDRLTREVVVTLIDKIYIHEDKTIDVVFRYANPFEEAIAYIEDNQYCLEKKDPDNM